MKNYEIKIKNENQFNEVVELAVKMGYKKPDFSYQNINDYILLREDGNINIVSCKTEKYQEITINQLRILADPESLIGRKVKGFKFEDREYNGLGFANEMNELLGKTGIIKKYYEKYDSFLITFTENFGYLYPLELIHEHLIKETMKITDLTEKQAVHCTTEEEAKRICKIAHEQGLKWRDGFSYLQENYWETHKEQTCYDFNMGAFADIIYHKERNYEIISSTQIIEEPQPKKETELKKVWAWDNNVELAFETYLIEYFPKLKAKYLCITEDFLPDYDRNDFFRAETYKNISETNPRTPDDVLEIVEKYGKDKLITIISKITRNNL